MNRIPTVYTVDAPTIAEGFVVVLSAVGGSMARVLRKGSKNGFRRRQIVVTNVSGSLNLRVNFQRPADAPDAADDDYSILVFPTTSITLFTDADVVISNGNAQSIRCAVTEVFYREP